MKWIRLLALIIPCLAVLVLTSCAPAASAPTNLPASESPAPTATVTMERETQAPAKTPEVVQGFPIEPGKNVLVLIKGEARISHDNGNTWSATGTGQYLVAGDEIQLTEGSLALVFLFNGAVIRLEGATDFQLQRVDKDEETGATQIIGKLWDGYGIFETNPLPTPDSLFQFYAMTSFIHVDYDAELAQAVQGSLDLDHERTIIAGGSLDDEDESLYVHRGPATIYVIGWDDSDQDYVAQSYPSEEEQVIEVDIEFFVDPRLEANIEGFLDTAGLLVSEFAQSGELSGEGMVGSIIDSLELQESGEVMLYFQTDPFVLPDDLNYVTNSQDRVSVQVTAVVLFVAGSPVVADVDVMILTGDGGFGCDLNTGQGCAAPEGCNLETGEACALPSGCNLVTREGCDRTHASCEIALQADDGSHVTGAELLCQESKQLECDPNLAGDCDAEYDASLWAEFDAEDEEEEWCWCRAEVPPGFPDPPPWMDMYYRCWCSDPGALPTRP